VSDRPVKLRQAVTAPSALDRLNEEPADLVFIDMDLPDGTGLALARQLGQERRHPQTVMICRTPAMDDVLCAVRAGVVDFLMRPLDAGEVRCRLEQALARHDTGRARRRRVRRLKRTCRRLNELRTEVAEQVDVLCSDLVTAYQDLAQQMQQAMHAREFTTVTDRELDFQQLLRKTLEYLLSKAGPTNAAIFLPSKAESFTLGGYVNHDCAGDSVDLLLEHLADTSAAALADLEEPLLITDNEHLHEWFGDDAAYLVDSHVLAFTCDHRGETLAVVMLFRDMAVPFDPTMLDAVETIGPILGENLSRLIRIHHRHVPWPDEDSWDSVA